MSAETIKSSDDSNPLGELPEVDEQTLVDNFTPTNNIDDFANSLESNKFTDALSKVDDTISRAAKLKFRWIIAGATVVSLAYLGLRHDSKTDTPVVVRHTDEQIERQCAASIPNIHDMDPAQVMIAVENCVDENSHPLLLQSGN